jgi:GTP cyclohydrolase III
MVKSKIINAVIALSLIGFGVVALSMSEQKLDDFKKRSEIIVSNTQYENQKLPDAFVRAQEKHTEGANANDKRREQNEIDRQTSDNTKKNLRSGGRKRFKTKKI